MCLVLCELPMTHTFVHKILRDVDLFELFLETMFRLIEDGWSYLIMFKIIKTIVMSCAHTELMPVIETNRQLLVELARKVLLAEIVRFEETRIVDESKVIEFLFFMHKIADDQTNHLVFRNQLHENIKRKCHGCQNLVPDYGGGRCGACT